MRFPALFLLLAALALPTGARAVETISKDTEYFDLWFLTDITIAPDGRVGEQAWRNFKEMPEPALRELTNKIAAWRFQPAIVDGEPVETQTSLIVHVLAIEREDGKFRTEVAGAVVGPSLQDGRWPEVDYPRPWRQGFGSGVQVFDVMVPPGGEATIEFREYIADTNRPAFKAGFLERAQDLVDQWVVRHERIAGRPVTAMFRQFVFHCRSGRLCAEQVAPIRRDLPRMPPQQPVPMSSVTALLTDVVTVVVED